MCSTSRPPTPRAPDVKDPIYMRNPWLDGLGINSEARGRNSLRIDLGSPVPGPGAPTPPPTVLPPPVIVNPPGGDSPGGHSTDDGSKRGIYTREKSMPNRRGTPTTGGPLGPLAIGQRVTGGPVPASPFLSETGGPNPPTRRVPTTGGPNPPSRQGPSTGGPNPPSRRLRITGGRNPPGR